jgi:hypothetical protein
MKITPLCFALFLLSLTACSTLKRHSPRTPPVKADPPETVIVTYHVTTGQEARLQDALARAWAIYQKEHMVSTLPHLIVRDKESGGQTRFIEVFTWASHAKPEHAPESVKTIWNEMLSCCEPRDGHPGLDGGEVDLLVPPLPAAKR